MNRPELNVEELNTTTDLTTPAAPESQGVVAPTAPPADDLWDVTVKGKTWKAPRTEVIAGYQRQQDYTQKTMELANLRRQYDEAHQKTQTQVDELRTWLQNPQNVYQYYLTLAQQGQGQAPQPGQGQQAPVTPEQMQAYWNQQANRHEQTIQTRLEAATHELEVRQLASQYTTEIETAIRSLQTTYPELQAYDPKDLSGVLRGDVAAHSPASLDEAKSLLAQAAQARAERLRTHFQTQQKQAATQTQKLQRGIEPPGGSVVPPTPGKQLKLDDPRLKEQIIADIMAANAAAQE
jgi:hypothetical protein